MKRTGVILAVVASAIILTAMTSQEREALVIHNSGCNLLLADGSIGYLSASRDVRVFTSGPSMRMCQGTISNPSRRTIHFTADNTGMLCEVNGETTRRWMETISASGEVSLVCRAR